MSIFRTYICQKILAAYCGMVLLGLVSFVLLGFVDIVAGETKPVRLEKGIAATEPAIVILMFPGWFVFFAIGLAFRSGELSWFVSVTQKIRDAAVGAISGVLGLLSAAFPSIAFIMWLQGDPAVCDVIWKTLDVILLSLGYFIILASLEAAVREAERHSSQKRYLPCLSGFMVAASLLLVLLVPYLG